MAGSIQFKALGCTGLLDSVRTQGQGQGVGSSILLRGKSPNTLARTVNHRVDSACKAVIAVAV